MSLRCRGTFLEVVEHVNTIEEIPISRGSYGHPELCAAPCIRAFYSKCTKGFLCEFCHFGHPKAKVKLYKPERQLFDSLEEATVLSLVLSLLREARCHETLACGPPESNRHGSQIRSEEFVSGRTHYGAEASHLRSDSLISPKRCVQRSDRI
eukprot:s6436_g1.t1